MNTEMKNKAFSPRRRKGRKGRQEIQNCLLLLSVLSVFAVKILGELVSKEDAFATDEHGITRKWIKSEPEALATVSKEEAFATDEHGKEE